MDTESEPFEGEAETPKSPHTVAPPTCHVEESESNGTSGARSTPSDSIAPFLPDHPLTHTTHVLVSSLRRTVRLAMRVLPVMSHGLSVSDSEFRKRFKSSYDSSPSSTFLVRKRYKGTFEIILDNDSEGDELGEEEDDKVEESSDLDSKSEDVEDDCPTVEDEDPVTEDEGHTAGDKGPSMEVKILGLGGDEAIPEDPRDSMVYIDVPAYPPSAPLAQTPPSPEWSSALLHVSLAPSIVPLPILSPMISLFVPSPVATLAMAKAEGFLTGGGQDEIFFYRYRFRSLEHEQERITVMFGALWRPVLALEACAGPDRVVARAEGNERSCYYFGAGEGPLVVTSRIGLYPSYLLRQHDRSVRNFESKRYYERLP
nr:hypothetical protein [Tanacetum cinerariifolium]